VTFGSFVILTSNGILFPFSFFLRNPDREPKPHTRLAFLAGCLKYVDYDLHKPSSHGLDGLSLSSFIPAACAASALASAAFSASSLNSVRRLFKSLWTPFTFWPTQSVVIVPANENTATINGTERINSSCTCSVIIFCA